MKPQIYRKLWLILLMAFLVYPLATLAAEPAENTAGPLSWQSTLVPPTFPATEAVKLASKYLGVSATAQPATQPQFVQVSDLTPYGNIAKTVYYAWLVTLPGVPVANANSKASAAIKMEVLVLVDANDKGLDAAFTAIKKQKWVSRYPSYQARDPFQVMVDDGWSVAKPRSAQPSATVSQVLSAFWSATGINPEDAGQLFLRPRYVALALPAKRSGGKLVPLNPPGTYWPVLVSGTKTFEVVSPPSASPIPVPTGETPYMSGLIALYSDIGVQPVRGVYLP
ncbi:MAG: hypothetical protein Q8N54_06565 [Sulfurimicrobium sp.]|nr:hypothetical protein [Sulfurimicrobium sp.]MDO9191009.1 hypothetical protein [Sulfurimicrobium sp.]MDP1704547.1 hypothetical protein [Sulfurimicrobium sp.]MDP2198190.1 hypothetical protein [Sulfurimicrobium sp.]MDP2962406.1 hypothetical protein [Sulfurimicrobium sp.]